MNDWIECKKELPAGSPIVTGKIDNAEGGHSLGWIAMIRGVWMQGEGEHAVVVRENPTHWRWLYPDAQANHQ